MRSDFLPFCQPSIGQEEIDEVVDTLKSEWITTGPKTRCFEREFAEYVAAPGALALSSCTAGLHLTLVALGIGPGDEVITTTITFAATANVIEHVGAKPVLVDVDPETLNIDPLKAALAVTPRTKAIIPVHFAGHPVDLAALEEIANTHGLHIIEDAAHAMGAKYRGRPIGCGDHPTSFSFYATKNITTAEGGMLTGNVKLLEQARILSLHGMTRDAWKRSRSDKHCRYEVVQPGFKYNMTDIQSSLGIWQLRKLTQFQKRRRQVVDLYHQAFARLEELEIPVERPDVEHAWHLYVLRLRPEMLTLGRDQFLDELKIRRIGTSVHFVPIHMHPFYSSKYGYKPRDFPVSYENSQRLLSLPLHPGLTDGDVADVIEAVCEVVKRHRRRAAA